MGKKRQIKLGATPDAGMTHGLARAVEPRTAAGEQPPQREEGHQQQRKQGQQQAAQEAPVAGHHGLANTAKMPAYGLTMKAGAPA